MIYEHSDKVWTIHYDDKPEVSRHVTAKSAEEAARKGQAFYRSECNPPIVTKVEFVAEVDEPNP